jgi:hypothetical protein
MRCKVLFLFEPLYSNMLCLSKLSPSCHNGPLRRKLVWDPIAVHSARLSGVLITNQVVNCGTLSLIRGALGRHSVALTAVACPGDSLTAQGLSRARKSRKHSTADTGTTDCSKAQGREVVHP